MNGAMYYRCFRFHGVTEKARRFKSEQTDRLQAILTRENKNMVQREANVYVIDNIRRI